MREETKPEFKLNGLKGLGLSSKNITVGRNEPVIVASPSVYDERGGWEGSADPPSLETLVRLTPPSRIPLEQEKEPRKRHTRCKEVECLLCGKGVTITPPEKVLKEPRKRHTRYNDAQRLFRDSSLDWARQFEVGSEDRTFLISLFRDYHEDVSKRCLVLHNKREDDGAEIIILPYLTRANPDYVRKIKQKLAVLQKKSSERAVFMTLTTDPKRFPSLKAAYRGLMKNKARLMDMLDKRFETRLQYISVIEFTKTGLPHLHLIVYGETFLLPQRELSDIWEAYGQGEVVDLRQAGKGFRNPSVYHYVMKYVTKSWDLRDDKPDNLFHVAALWALDARSFTVSQGLLESVKREELWFVCPDCSQTYLDEPVEFLEKVSRDDQFGLWLKRRGQGFVYQGCSHIGLISRYSGDGLYGPLRMSMTFSEWERVRGDFRTNSEMYQVDRRKDSREPIGRVSAQ